MPESTCKRRWFTTDPGCTCPDCLVIRYRNAKVRRVVGATSLQQRSDAAFAALDRMLAAGRAVSEIAATAGIGWGALNKALVRRRKGQWHRMNAYWAEAIVAAEHAEPAGGMVDALGTTRRLQALGAIGWGTRRLAELTGAKETTLKKLRAGLYRRTPAQTAKAVATLYTSLENTPGTCRGVAARCRAKGWIGPEWWDDDTIDDPEAEPDTGRTEKRDPRRITDRKKVILEDVMEILRAGETIEVAAWRLEVDEDSIRDAARRRGTEEEKARIAAASLDLAEMRRSMAS